MFPGCNGNVTRTKDGYACDEVTEEVSEGAQEVVVDEAAAEEATATDGIVEDGTGMDGIDTGEISADLAVEDV